MTIGGKKWLLVLTALLCSFNAYAAGAREEATSRDLVLGTLHPVVAPSTQAAQHFADRIGELTEGRYEVRVVPAAGLGSSQEQFENMFEGVQDMHLTGYTHNQHFVPDYNAATVPFLFRDREHFIRFLESDVMEGFEQRVEELGAVTLNNQFIFKPRHVHSVNRLDTIDDIQGVRIRVPNWPAYMVSFDAIGFSPQPVDWGEKYLALQTGAVDAGEVPVQLFYDQKFYEVSNYVWLTSHAFDTQTLTISKQVWDQIPTADQTLFAQAANEAALFFQDLMASREQEIRDTLEDEHGITFSSPSRDVREEMERRVLNIVGQLEGDLWPTVGLYESIADM